MPTMSMSAFGDKADNAAKVDIRHNRIVSPRLPKAFDALTIIQLSDLHVEMSEAAMERVVDLLREARYDVCVLTGDYRGRTCGPYDTTLAGMARVIAAREIERHDGLARLVIGGGVTLSSSFIRRLGSASV
jgi:hypothetical protein